MSILKDIINQAKNVDAKIILPEANMDIRVLTACEKAIKMRLGKFILLGAKEEFPLSVQNSNLVEFIDINTYEDTPKMADMLYELRKSKGLTKEKANELIHDNVYFACMLLYMKKADGMVAGAKYTTADVLRPALQIVKTKKNKKLVVGCVLLVREKAPNVLLFLDSSLNPNPNSEQLAEIGISGGEFMQDALKINPRIAFLSYSTHGSAEGELVEKVRNATNIAKSNSSMNIDGEMQFDTAVDPLVAKSKGITSTVGGYANVMVFPDLNSGNISYKILNRLAGYKAIGPVMLNFRYPINDLSRGCTAEEIIYTIAITKLQKN